jgi:hypothetical protein
LRTNVSTQTILEKNEKTTIIPTSGARTIVNGQPRRCRKNRFQTHRLPESFLGSVVPSLALERKVASSLGHSMSQNPSHDGTTFFLRSPRHGPTRTRPPRVNNHWSRKDPESRIAMKASWISPTGSHTTGIRAIRECGSSKRELKGFAQVYGCPHLHVQRSPPCELDVYTVTTEGTDLPMRRYPPSLPEVLTFTSEGTHLHFQRCSPSHLKVPTFTSRGAHLATSRY